MSESERKKPLDVAADVLFYAPLGFLLSADEVIPQLVERGRQQVQMARMFGQFAVQQGQAEAGKLGKRLQSQGSDVVGQLLGLGNDQRGAPTSARPTVGGERAEKVDGADERSAATVDVAPGPDVESLAIPDYDSLSASQVVPRLAGLSAAELEAVRAYEAANRGRKTILNKVAQLQSA